MKGRTMSEYLIGKGMKGNGEVLLGAFVEFKQNIY
jgi:hypothetical protein